MVIMEGMLLIVRKMESITLSREVMHPLHSTPHKKRKVMEHRKSQGNYFFGVVGEEENLVFNFVIMMLL